ncbi:hypothetical protein [Streptomyces globisporus]|uniref:hypothetical protein n=1 Tax=Streptomyces globisporus TaxID=1908 RepID=UPI00367CCF00
MRFSADDVVMRVHLNLQQVSTADEALRAWLPLVSELQPMAVQFEAAHPDGLRQGFLADLLVSFPLMGNAAVGGETVRDWMFSTVAPFAERLGLDPSAFEFDDDGAGGVLSPKADSVVCGDTPYGAYLLLVKIGMDPLVPGGEEADCTGSGGDL